MRDFLALSILLNVGCFAALIISRIKRHELRETVTRLLSRNAVLSGLNQDLSDVLQAYQGAWHSHIVQERTDEYLAERIRAKDIEDIELGMGG